MSELVIAFSDAYTISQRGKTEFAFTLYTAPSALGEMVLEPEKLKDDAVVTARYQAV